MPSKIKVKYAAALMLILPLPLPLSSIHLFCCFFSLRFLHRVCCCCCALFVHFFYSINVYFGRVSFAPVVPLSEWDNTIVFSWTYLLHAATTATAVAAAAAMKRSFSIVLRAHRAWCWMLASEHWTLCQIILVDPINEKRRTDTRNHDFKKCSSFRCRASVLCARKCKDRRAIPLWFPIKFDFRFDDLVAAKERNNSQHKVCNYGKFHILFN